MLFSKSKSKSTADDVRRVALAALAAALEDRWTDSRSKPGRTGLRAVATGAVLYTAGRAVYSGRHLILERLGDGAVDEDDREDEEYDEPEAEGDEDEEEDLDEEPEAEGDEDEEEDLDEEPEAEGRGG